MKALIYSITIALSIVYNASSQTVTGTIIYHDASMGGMEMPVSFASVYWLNGTSGTTADVDGKFTLPHPDSAGVRFIVSSVGYRTDTLAAMYDKPMKIILEKAIKLKEVVVTDNQLSYVSTKAYNQLNIGSGELKLAACCNLGEAFQTTPQIDVSTTDAVSGSRQIQLLGLTGNYTQILIENTPQLFGLSKSFGLDYIPGPWVESMQLTQGVGSVLNGYDGLNGAINVELKKPNKKEDFFINLYGNSFGRYEANINSSLQLNSHWSTILLAHADETSNMIDANHDGFMDMPSGKQIHLGNRWLYVEEPNKGYMVHVGFDVLSQQKFGGQMGFNTNENPNSSTYYGISIKTEREAGYAKIGYISKENSYVTSGLILSAYNHQQDGYFGRTAWNAKEQNFNAKFIYQTIINNTNNIIRVGASFLYDDEKENLIFNDFHYSINYPVLQSVPGGYAEYDFTGKAFTAVVGARGDYNNNYGFVFTPRGFIKFNLTKSTTLKLIAGSAFHQPDIISENASLLASSRKWVIQQALNPERAINVGAAFQQNFSINSHDGDFIINGYHTWFNDQVIVDLNADPTKVLFYNLNGSSFADNLLVQFDYSFIKNLNMKLAYRYNNVQEQEQNGLAKKTFVVQDKFYAGLDYTTKNKHWKVSCNWQYYGQQYLPYTLSNPEEYRTSGKAPAYQILNAQITYILKAFELYVGGENLLNQTQKQVIVNSKNPFAEYFDASMVWGPVTGQLFYAGLRFSLK